MKSLFLVIIVCLGFNTNNFLAQSFINGDFETNLSSGCDYNLTDSLFNTRISNVTAFGKGFNQPGGYAGEIDIQTFGCYVNPQNGNWCLGLAADTTLTSDAITIELNTSLTVGQNYELSFYVYGNTEFVNTTLGLEIGESLFPTEFGLLIDSITPDAATWKHILLSFTAKQNSNFISVKIKPGIPGWTQIDNFTINSITTSTENFNPNPKRVVYPNPAHENLTVDFKESISSGFVTLTSTTGQLFRKIKIMNKEDIDINLNGIPTGVYFIKIESKEVSEILTFIKE